MSIVSAGRVISLPAFGGGQSLTRADEPLGAGRVQILASNATHLCRESSLRTLWEDDGTPIGSTQLYAGLLAPGLTPETLWWDGETTNGALMYFCGAHRLRPYGEQTTALPIVSVRWRWGVTVAAAGSNSTGAVCVVTPTPTYPSLTYPYATTSVTDVVAPLPALVDGGVDVTVPVGVPAPRTTGPYSGSPPTAPTEHGFVDTVCVWLGFWNTSGKVAEPGEVHGITVYLREP